MNELLMGKGCILAKTKFGFHGCISERVKVVVVTLGKVDGYTH